MSNERVFAVAGIIFMTAILLFLGAIASSIGYDTYRKYKEDWTKEHAEELRQQQDAKQRQQELPARLDMWRHEMRLDWHIGCIRDLDERVKKLEVKPAANDIFRNPRADELP